MRATNFANRYVGFVSYGIPGGQPADRGPGGYKLGIAPNGNILFTLFAVVDVDSTVPYPFDGEWHHVAASYSIADGGVRFYLDGQDVGLVAETNDIKPPGTVNSTLALNSPGCEDSRVPLIGCAFQRRP